MGCDIHLMTEHKRHINDKEVWVNCDHFYNNPYYDKDNPDGEKEWQLESIYSHRDYNLFSRLAGVRKYDEIYPTTISEPKGLPDDISKLTKKFSDDWGSDGHSHSWLTYKELEQYRFDYGYDSICIKEVLDLMEKRMREVMWIYNKEDIPADKKDKFRIVFWFDN